METVVTRFETNISENNLRHWGMVEVVKEFLQNIIFAKTILGDTIEITHDGCYAILKNTPSGFSKGKLLIGESEQAGVAGAPGEYGEGMKAAMAVARRNGSHVEVYTNGFNVTPQLESSTLDNSLNALVFYIEDTKDCNGTTFQIECDLDTLNQAKCFFAVLNDIAEEDTKKDTIIETIVDTIFVNGVKVTSTNSALSYNFTSADLMNRDRTSVDMDKVRRHVANTLSSIEDDSIAAVVLQSIVSDNSLLEAISGITCPVHNIHVWNKARVAMFGQKVAMATGTETDTKALYHKFKVLTTIPQAWKYFFREYLGVPYSSDLAEVAIKHKNIHRKPNTEESTTLGWAKRLVKMYYGDYGTVKVSDEVFDDYQTPCYGTYDRKTDTIWIKRSILDSKEETFKTLLHETIHRVSGAEDNTPRFTREWERACWGILMRGSDK